MSEQLLQQIDDLLNRRIGVFAEDIQHKLDLVVEGQQMLEELLGRFEVEVRAEFVKVDQRITVVHAGLDQKIDQVEQKLSDKIESAEQKLSDRIDDVEQKLSDRIDGVEQKLSDRIDGVEQSLTSHIDAVAADLAAHRRDTEAHRIYGVRE